jgi:predicted DsbA family dithiol-disulfide isomerase
MRIDIFSDVICPWCFIGKRRLERALRDRPQDKVEICWRAFQLNPDMPVQGMPRQVYLQTKFGGPERAEQIYDNIRANGEKEGIAFRFDLIEHTPNTVKAHRLLRHATNLGKGDAMAERLFTGYFLDGVNIGEIDALVDLAVEVEMDGDESRAWLEGNEEVAEIMAETRFAYENGINGVPCFVFNRRYALAGAQEPEAFYPLFELANNEGEQPVAANMA